MSYFIDCRGTEGMQNVWSIEGDASGMIGGGNVIRDILVGFREVEIVGDWMGGN